MDPINISKNVSTKYLGPLNTTHHVFFEFQPRKRHEETCTGPYKHEMASPKIQILNESEIETIK